MAPITPAQWTARITAVRDQLKANGVDFTHGEGECGRFEVTKHFAWTYRADGIKLVAKFGGQNGCSQTNTLGDPKYAIDAIILEGQTYDILTGLVTPQWMAVPGDPSLAREPFNPGGATTPPPSTGDPALEARVAKLEADVVELQATVASLTLVYPYKFGLKSVSNAKGESKVLSIWDQPQATANRDWVGIGEEFTIEDVKEWRNIPK